MATFRPLQPAPMDQEQSPQPQSRPLTQKPKRTVTLGACAACRKRKSKCDGLRPTCRCCALKETDCVYDVGPHEKPLQAMKRKNEEMQGELSNLRELYDFLRFRPEQEALEILRRIRQSDPDTNPSQHVRELADSVRYGGLSVENQQPATVPEQLEAAMLPSIRATLQSVDFEHPSFANTPRFPHSILGRDLEIPMSQKRRYVPPLNVSARVAANSGSSSRSPMDTMSEQSVASQASDPRLRLAINWTSVTDDADFAAHLLTQWHRCEYRYYHFLDWNLFLEHMASGKKAFCSELLVNTVLAAAGFHSPLVKDRSKPFTDNAITYFYNEARRLWDAETTRISLPRLQAAMILFLVLGKNGRDKDGHQFLLEACQMARELGLAESEHTAAAQCPVDVSQDDWSRVRAVTAWSLFNFQMSMSFTYSIPVILTSPPPDSIPGHSADHEEVLFRSECARQVIMLDVSKVLSEIDIEAGPAASSFGKVDDLYLRLKSWWNDRPAALDPSIHTSPENLLFAMIYHTSTIRLMRPFLRQNSTKEVPSPHAPRAQSIYSTSLKSLRRLLTLHEVHHGWQNAITFILHPVVITSFGCLDEIAADKPSHLSLEMHESYLGLLTCLRAVSAISGFIYYAQPLLRLLTQACLALDVRLPREITEAVERYRSEEWTREARSLVRSTYVADTRDAVEDLEARRMDAVIAQWEAFTFGKGKGKERERDTEEA